jgi:endonuclease III
MKKEMVSKVTEQNLNEVLNKIRKQVIQYLNDAGESMADLTEQELIDYIKNCPLLNNK